VEDEVIDAEILDAMMVTQAHFEDAMKLVNPRCVCVRVPVFVFYLLIINKYLYYK